jgi:hypothetical protein
VSQRLLTTAERWRRYQRDLDAYRQRSLFRRSYSRFRRDLDIVPHIFLLPGAARIAPLGEAEEAVRIALRGKAVWTLDTAARLVSGRGFLTSADLTGYLSKEDLRAVRDAGLIGEPQPSGLSVDPLYQRAPMLIAHLDENVPHIELPSGDRVVPWDFLARDILGTLGWRPDLLTRLEATYPGGLPH